MKDEIPTLQEELQRKAISALEKMSSDRALGKCTHAQCEYALSIMWESVSGLTTWSEFGGLAEIINSFGVQDGSNHITKAYWNDRTGWFATVTNQYNGIVTIKLVSGTTFVSDKVYDLTEETNRYKAGMDKFNALCDNLVFRNFKLI